MENLVKDRGAKSKAKNLKKGKQPTIQSKPGATRVKTVAPNNDCGEADPSIKERSSNVGQGPAVENL
jgi:hypothetical protein